MKYYKLNTLVGNRIAVNLAFFTNGFVYANWVSRLPRIQEQFQADNGTIGVVLLFMSLGAVLAMPFTGWLIIRKGSRTISLISLLTYCAFVPLIPLMPGVTSLIFLYVIIGISTGMLDVAMNAQAVMVEQQYKKPIMTSFHAFFSIGMALGGWCGALFAGVRIDLSSHFAIIAGVGLMAAFWVRGNLIQDKPEVSLMEDGPLFRVPNRSLLTIGIIALCCMIGEGAISDWSVNYMENIARSPEFLAPIALSSFAMAMTAGRLFGDRFRSMLGDKKLIILGGLISTVGLSIVIIFPTPFISISGFFMVGLGLSTIVPIAYSIAGNTKGIPPGVGLAMVTTVGYSGFLFGPPIIGFIADLSNLRWGLLVVAALFLVMTSLGFTRKTQPAKGELL